MTGAPVPPGCDAVVMHERTRHGDGLVVIEQTSDQARPEPAAARGGDACRRLGAEPRIRASSGPARGPGFGGTRPRCGPFPGRGSRSCPPATSWSSPAKHPGRARSATRTPSCFAPWQSNPVPWPPHFRSRATSRTSWHRILEQALEADLVLVTGGVSAGQRDLVPDALASLGVRKVFHKINLKPGKPLWFGVAAAGAGRAGHSSSDCPATRSAGSSVSCCSSGRHSRLWPAGSLRHLARSKPGWRAGSPSAATASPIFLRGSLPAAEPAAHGLPSIATLDWSGSADLRTVAAADGFAVFPAGDRDYAAGEIVGYLPMRSAPMSGQCLTC